MTFRSALPVWFSKTTTDNISTNTNTVVVMYSEEGQSTTHYNTKHHYLAIVVYIGPSIPFKQSPYMYIHLPPPKASPGILKRGCVLVKHEK